MTEMFIIEANVTTLSQMTKLPLDVCQWINNINNYAKEESEKFKTATKNNILPLAKCFKLYLTHEFTDEPEMGSDQPYGYEINQAMDAFKMYFEKWGRKIILLCFDKSFSQKFSSFKKFTEVINLINNNEEKLERQNVEQLRKRSLKTYPNKYFWVKLEKKEWDNCGEKMQHCGRPLSSNGEIYQLIDENGEFKVSIEMTPKKIIEQIKGKQNAFPEEKYWDYVVDFINSNDALNRESRTPDKFKQKMGVTDGKVQELKHFLTKLYKNLSDDTELKEALLMMKNDRKMKNPDVYSRARDFAKRVEYVLSEIFEYTEGDPDKQEQTLKKMGFKIDEIEFNGYFFYNLEKV